MTSSWSNRSSNPRRVTVGCILARRGYACTYSSVAAACICQGLQLGQVLCKALLHVLSGVILTAIL